MFCLLLLLMLDTTSIKSPQVKSLCHLEIQVNPSDIVALVMSDKRIYMTVLLEGRVFVFDHDGKRQPDIGQKGQGPAEFMYPMAMALNHDGLYVLDNGKSRLILVDPSSGSFLKTLAMERANKLLIHDGFLYAAFNNALSRTQGIFGKAPLQEPITFQRPFFSDPCCLKVKGSKIGGMTLDRNGHFWCAYSGSYRLEKYDRDDQLLKIVSDTPNDYVVPSVSKTSRFNRNAMKQHFRSFDKIGGLFNLDDMIVVYRYKSLDSARLDFYDLDGQAIALGVDISGLAIAGVHHNSLYGYRSLEESLEADVELVRLEF